MPVVQSFLIFSIVTFLSLSLAAEIYETPRKYKEISVSLDEASSINITLFVTEKVDNCNHYNLNSTIQSIGEEGSGRYIVDLNIISTRMFCGEARRERVFSHTFTFPGPKVFLLVPEHVRVSAVAGSED